MKFDILTLFPEMFSGPLSESLLKKAQEKGLVSINVTNIRDFATDKHKTADDSPYGGGSGMVMKAAPIVAAISNLSAKGGQTSKTILLCPTGKPLTQKKINQLAKEKHLILVCGHYEGVDERVRDYVDEEISIGDYVLTGGEIPAMVLIDAVARQIPGVVKEQESVTKDSFYNGMLDYPCYTRPEEFDGKKVPEVLLSGNHAEIEKWRQEEALEKTNKQRPDLLKKVYLALVHHPIYNKRKDVVTTSITGFDLHDIARTAITFGIKKYYVVNPLPAQQAFANRIIDFWMDDGSMEFNWTRAEAFKLISIKSELEEVIKEIEKIEGVKPRVVATSAKAKGSLSFEKLRKEIKSTGKPYLIVLGTGWGLADEAFAQVDVVLEPILGTSDYNHLPVRSANAIILDRLLGK